MKILLKIAFCLSVFTAFGQFPERWLGNYAGTMNLSNAGAPDDSLEVSLDIMEVQPDSVWTYSMHYHHPKYGAIEKNYHIVRAADGKGFIMDERNGILIQMSYMNDCFYEYFEVDGMLYSTTMRRIAGGILFEIFGASNQPSLKTDSEPDENNTVYKVLSMKPTFAQSALLMPTE
ncbi:MAG: hypothetical protein ACK45H_04450 [Bacteroidota bacterium]|jgi:hypothetical protein